MKFHSMAHLIDALAFQLLLHTQVTFAFLASDPRLFQRVDALSQTRRQFLFILAGALDHQSTGEENMDQSAPMDEDLLSVIRYLLFDIGQAGPHTLPILQDILFLPQVNTAPGLPLTNGPAMNEIGEVQLLAFNSWRHLAQEIAARFNMQGLNPSQQSMPRQDDLNQLCDFFQEPEHGVLLNNDGDSNDVKTAPLQLTSNELRQLLESSNGSLPQLLLHLRYFVFHRRSFNDASTLIDSVQVASKDLLLMQASIWTFLRHPQCSLIDRDALMRSGELFNPPTYADVHRLLIESECGLHAYGYIRTMHAQKHSYTDFDSLIVALRDMHHRTLVDRANGLDRLLQFLRSDSCTLFSKPQMDTPRSFSRNDLEELMELGNEVEVIAKAMQSTQQTQPSVMSAEKMVNRLVALRLVPLDADPNQARFNNMKALIDRVRSIIISEARDKSTLSRFLSNRQQMPLFANSTVQSTVANSSQTIDTMYDACRNPNQYVHSAPPSPPMLLMTSHGRKPTTIQLSPFSLEQLMQYCTQLSSSTHPPRASTVEQLVQSIVGMHMEAEKSARDRAQQHKDDLASLRHYLEQDSMLLKREQDEHLSEAQLEEILAAGSSAGTKSSYTGHELASALLHLRHLDLAHTRCANIPELLAMVRSREQQAAATRQQMFDFLKKTTSRKQLGGSSLLTSPTPLTMQQVHQMYVLSGAGEMCMQFLSQFAQSGAQKKPRPSGRSVEHLTSSLAQSFTSLLVQHESERTASREFLSRHRLLAADAPMSDLDLDSLRVIAPMATLLHMMQILVDEGSNDNFTDVPSLCRVVEERIHVQRKTLKQFLTLPVMPQSASAIVPNIHDVCVGREVWTQPPPLPPPVEGRPPSSVRGSRSRASVSGAMSPSDASSTYDTLLDTSLGINDASLDQLVRSAGSLKQTVRYISELVHEGPASKVSSMSQLDALVQAKHKQEHTWKEELFHRIVASNLIQKSSTSGNAVDFTSEHCDQLFDLVMPSPPKAGLEHLHYQLNEMEKAHQSFPSGSALVEAIVKHRSSKLSDLRSYLRGEGSVLLASSTNNGAPVDLSDAALEPLLVAAIHPNDCMKQLGRLAAAGNVYSSVSELVSAVSLAHQQDMKDCAAIVDYVNAHSSLLTASVKLNVNDADALLASVRHDCDADAARTPTLGADSQAALSSSVRSLAAKHPHLSTTAHTTLALLHALNADSVTVSDIDALQSAVLSKRERMILHHFLREGQGSMLWSPPGAAAVSMNESELAALLTAAAPSNDSSQNAESTSTATTSTNTAPPTTPTSATTGAALMNCYKYACSLMAEGVKCRDMSALITAISSKVTSARTGVAALRPFLSGSAVLAPAASVRDETLEQLLALSGSRPLSDLTDMLTRMGVDGDVHGDGDSLVDGVRRRQKAEREEMRTFLASDDGRQLFSEEARNDVVDKQLTDEAIERLLAESSHPSIARNILNGERQSGNQYRDMNALIRAVKEVRQKQLLDRAKVVGFINQQSMLIKQPTKINYNEAEQIINLYEGRPVDDVLEALQRMHDRAESYSSPRDLIASFKRHLFEDIHALRKYLQEAGKSLLSDADAVTDTAPSDEKLNALLGSWHGIVPTLDHCTRLLAAGRVFASVDELRSALLTSYASDHEDRTIVRRYVNDESNLLQPPLKVSENDAATLLAMREGRSTEQLIVELKLVDQDKLAPFKHLEELSAALESQRVAEALAEQAAIKNELRSYLEQSSLFNEIKVRMSGGDLEALLAQCGSLPKTRSLCDELQEAGKSFFSLQDLLKGLKKMLALEAEKEDAYAFLKDESTCQLWRDLDPAGSVPRSIEHSHVETLYAETKIGTGTLAKIQELNDSCRQFKTFQQLIDALREMAPSAARPSLFGAGLQTQTHGVVGAELNVDEHECEDEDEEDEIAALPASPRSGRSRHASMGSMPFVDGDGMDVPSAIANASSHRTSQGHGHGRAVSEASALSPMRTFRNKHGKKEYRDPTQWLNDDLSAQLIEQADPSTFEEFAALKIRCKNLLHVGKIGMSNIFLQFSRERNHIWERCGGTNAVRDDLSPSFNLLIISLLKLCHMQMERKIKVEALEIANNDGQKPLLIGQLIVTPAELFEKGTGYEWELLDPARKRKSKSYKHSGILCFDELSVMVNTTKGVLQCDKRLFNNRTGCRVQFQMQAKHIPKMDLFGLSDPYCVFELQCGHGASKSWREVFRTEVQDNTLNPVWLPRVLNVHDLCEGEVDRKIRVKMYDYDKVGEHDYIGQFTMTLRQMLTSMLKFRVIDESKVGEVGKSGDSYKHSGTVTFNAAQHYSMTSDVDREANQELVKHKREYEESTITPAKRKSFLAFLAGGQALEKAQALVRMATGLAIHKTAEELAEEANKLRQQKQQQQLHTEGLQRMATSMQLFKQQQQTAETVQFIIRGESLPKMDLFGLSDPFLEFFKQKSSLDVASASASSSASVSSATASTSASSASPNGLGSMSVSHEWEYVCSTEVCKNTLNPKWPPLVVKSAAFMTAAPVIPSALAPPPLPTPDSNKVLIRCYDWNSNGSKDFIGELVTDWQMLRKCRETRLELIWSDGRNSMKKRGWVIFESCKAIQIKTDKREIPLMRRSSSVVHAKFDSDDQDRDQHYGGAPVDIDDDRDRQRERERERQRRRRSGGHSLKRQSTGLKRVITGLNM